MGAQYSKKPVFVIVHRPHSLFSPFLQVQFQDVASKGVPWLLFHVLYDVYEYVLRRMFFFLNFVEIVRGPQSSFYCFFLSFVKCKFRDLVSKNIRKTTGFYLLVFFLSFASANSEIWPQKAYEKQEGVLFSVFHFFHMFSLELY